MSLEIQNRIKFAFLPTPIQHLNRISKLLNGPEIFIKRDDQTGLALGGNKTRKLEYLFGDALSKDIDTIVTAGAVQSNHCRQTAAAAAQLGLRCELLLNGKEPEQYAGNTFLDLVLGAKITWRKEANAPQTLEELAQKVKESGYKPYIIPYGGSNEIGTLGYVNAMLEFMEQHKSLAKPISHIILASCSGGTQVGLVIGAKLTNFRGKIIGISVDYNNSKAQEYLDDHIDLGIRTIKKLGLEVSLNPSDFIINYDYAQGYGKIGNLEQNAIKLLAKEEGILLDPVYTARAFGALLDMVAKKEIKTGDNVLFWHTGGAPTLFAYSQELV